MTRQAVIRMFGNALDISGDGRSPLPIEIQNLLAMQLQYRYIRVLRGQNAIDWSGRRRPIQEELRLLYTTDKYGRMVCGIGLLSRVSNFLEAAGYQVILQDLNPPHSRPNRFKEDWDNVAQNFTFKARQDECLIKIAANQRGIVEAPTGWGKTYLFRAIGLLYPNARIVITTKRKDLVEGIRLDLTSVLPNIGQIGGGMNRPGRITVVTANSLHRVNAAETDIVIGEEVHELAADTHSKKLAEFKNCRMYGFTATPDGRIDNADMRLESLFGPIIFTMTYQEAVELNLVVPIRVRWLEVRGDNPCGGMNDVPKRRWGIWRHDVRNQIIANAAHEFDDDEQVLIMVTTFDHAAHLKPFLPEFTLCYAERDDENFNWYKEKGFLPEDEPRMTAQRRQDLRQSFARGDLKKVIATDVWSTGVSFNKLGVLIRADARSSEILDTQIPGRVSRLNPATGKMEGLVIDCQDEFDAGFRGAARKRKRNYESKGWTQDVPRTGRPDLRPN